MLLLDDPAKPPPQPAGILPVLNTGQTRCYDNTQEITCQEPGEPFYGQDANYQPRVPRSYTKIGDGGDELSYDELHIDNGGSWIMTRDQCHRSGVGGQERGQRSSKHEQHLYLI